MGEKYNPNHLLIKDYRFIESKKEDDKKSKSQPVETITERVKLRRQKVDDDSDEFIVIPNMPPLEGNEEEVKEVKGLNILTRNKLSTRPPILLAQIKAGNNLYKLKHEIRQIKLEIIENQHYKITKKVYSNLMKSI